MNVSCGIVGLPNVGKSTLFNALLKKQQALAANYPFATIEPNVGIVAVPDERLEILAKITAEEIAGPKGGDSGQARMTLPPIKFATVEFVDIAGLVKGASEGAGLGNKFLGHIKEVSVIVHVVRAFEDPSTGSGQAPILREGSVDPKTDYETIETELMLADLATVQKALENRKMKAVRKEVLEKVCAQLEAGAPVRSIDLTDKEQEQLKDLFLLSAKPEIIVLNVSENQYNPEGIAKVTKEYQEILKQVQDDEGDNMVVICAQIESELAGLSEEEQKEYLKDLGLEKSGLERLIQKAYTQLGLISFLTAGEKEVRAWTIQKGSTAPQAAGEIHTDFIKKFIKAEVVSYEDFIQNNGWKGSREHGKARLEGKEYIMKDGDVVEFKIGA